jgi:hypothetical protein
VGLLTMRELGGLWDDEYTTPPFGEGWIRIQDRPGGWRNRSVRWNAVPYGARVWVSSEQRFVPLELLAWKLARDWDLYGQIDWDLYAKTVDPRFGEPRIREAVAAWNFSRQQHRVAVAHRNDPRPPFVPDRGSLLRRLERLSAESPRPRRAAMPWPARPTRRFSYTMGPRLPAPLPAGRRAPGHEFTIRPWRPSGPAPIFGEELDAPQPSRFVGTPPTAPRTPAVSSGVALTTTGSMMQLQPTTLVSLPAAAQVTAHGAF